jgi:hypothetical protein
VLPGLCRRCGTCWTGRVPSCGTGLREQCLAAHTEHLYASSVLGVCVFVCKEIDCEHCVHVEYYSLEKHTTYFVRTAAGLF